MFAVCSELARLREADGRHAVRQVVRPRRAWRAAQRVKSMSEATGGLVPWPVVAAHRSSERRDPAVEGALDPEGRNVVRCVLQGVWSPARIPKEHRRGREGRPGRGGPARPAEDAVRAAATAPPPVPVVRGPRTRSRTRVSRSRSATQPNWAVIRVRAPATVARRPPRSVEGLPAERSGKRGTKRVAEVLQCRSEIAATRGCSLKTSIAGKQLAISLRCASTDSATWTSTTLTRRTPGERDGGIVVGRSPDGRVPARRSARTASADSRGAGGANRRGLRKEYAAARRPDATDDPLTRVG